MAVSLYHQGDNLNRQRLRELTGQPAAPTTALPRPTLPQWLQDWIAWDGDRHEQMDSLPGVMWHYSDAWPRRDEDNIVLVHYDDLATDLDGQMRRLAKLLRIEVPEANWAGLIRAATGEQMRGRAEELAPGWPDALGYQVL